MSEATQNIITIDGPAASGKSSLSRNLSIKTSWKWLSTGAFYRAVGLLAHREGVSQDDQAALLDLLTQFSLEVKADPVQTQVFIDGQACSLEEVYSVENGTRASNVSRHPKIRQAVLDLQRSCYEEPGLIAEGRDCGDVIFPEAQLKIYLVADSSSRASRRSQESQEELESVKEALKTRDHQDSTRKEAPMQAPQGAWIIDTTDLSLDEVTQLVFNKAKQLFSL